MDIGIPELLIVLVIVVLFFGTGRLVNLGKEVSQGIREFRDGLKSPENSEAEEIEPPADQATNGEINDTNS